MIEREVVKNYEGTFVKLVTNKFALYGTILEVKQECLIFQTKQKTSVISLDAIQIIEPWED